MSKPVRSSEKVGSDGRRLDIQKRQYRISGGIIRSLSSNKDICALGCVAWVVFIVLPATGHDQRISPELVARAASSRTQDEDEKPRSPASARAISAATSEVQKAVNGKASVRNRCHVQRGESEIEENSEIIEADHCKLVVKTTKTTHAGDTANESSSNPQQSVEFMIYADLSELTTPVLVEPQKFAQCDAGGAGVLKVSSRSDPKQPMKVIRRSETTKPGEGEKQTRKDLSLFFADPKAAKKAADALDRAVRACGGKQWPDEDDLP